MRHLLVRLIVNAAALLLVLMAKSIGPGDAVIVPSFWNAGLSVPIFSSGAANGSSSSTTTDFPFFDSISTMAISRLNFPLRIASCARWWLAEKWI